MTKTTQAPIIKKVYNVVGKVMTSDFAHSYTEFILFMTTSFEEAVQVASAGKEVIEQRWRKQDEAKKGCKCPMMLRYNVSCENFKITEETHIIYDSEIKMGKFIASL